LRAQRLSLGARFRRQPARLTARSAGFGVDRLARPSKEGCHALNEQDRCRFALMILAPRPLYPNQTIGASTWGLTPMEDQQLAGLVMWIPAGLAFLAAICWLFMRWMRDAESREDSSAMAAARFRSALSLADRRVAPWLRGAIEPTKPC
jgi:hypothetical protein